MVSTVENSSRSNRVDEEHGGFSCQLDLAHRTVRFEHWFLLVLGVHVALVEPSFRYHVMESRNLLLRSRLNNIEYRSTKRSKCCMRLTCYFSRGWMRTFDPANILVASR